MIVLTVLKVFSWIQRKSARKFLMV